MQTTYSTSIQLGRPSGTSLRAFLLQSTVLPRQEHCTGQAVARGGALLTSAPPPVSTNIQTKGKSNQNTFVIIMVSWVPGYPSARKEIEKIWYAEEAKYLRN